MLRLSENYAASGRDKVAGAKNKFNHIGHNRIAVDQYETTNRLLLRLRNEGLSHTEIGDKIGITRRSIIKRLHSIGVLGNPNLQKIQESEKETINRLEGVEIKLRSMSCDQRRMYIMLRHEAVRLRVEKRAKLKAIASNLHTSQRMVKEVLVDAGFRHKPKRLNWTQVSFAHK